MKRVVIVAFGGSILIGACHIGDSGSTSSEKDTIAQSDFVSTSGKAAGVDSSDTHPFVEVQNKMMQNLLNMTMTGDPDHDFAKMMKQYFRVVIGMSQIELSRGDNEKLRQAAQKIIDESQVNINDLDSFLSDYRPLLMTDFSRKAMEKMTDEPSQINMENSGDIDQQFAFVMAIQFQQGIEIAREYLKFGKNPNTKKVANRVIKTYSSDLKKLKKWQNVSSTGAFVAHIGKSELSMRSH